MRTNYRSKKQRISDALDEARADAFRPIEYMNRKERRTKVGRIMQRECEKNLMAATLAILQSSVDMDDE